jgi:hypothetical protein
VEQPHAEQARTGGDGQRRGPEPRIRSNRAMRGEIRIRVGIASARSAALAKLLVPSGL